MMTWEAQQHEMEVVPAEVGAESVLLVVRFQQIVATEVAIVEI
jgi:hypothetical protein